jgi:predicted Zn-dependent protease
MIGSIGWLVLVGVVTFAVVLGLSWSMGSTSDSIPTRTTTVQVHSGQTLWTVAQHAAPSASAAAVVDRIRSLNGLGDDAVLYPGELLRVPSGR